MAHKAKMISTMESPSFKREIIPTHIQEYKRLKPKEVDQSELSRHAHRTSTLTPIKQICPYENTRDHTFKSIKD